MKGSLAGLYRFCWPRDDTLVCQATRRFRGQPDPPRPQWAPLLFVNQLEVPSFDGSPEGLPLFELTSYSLSLDHEAMLGPEREPG